MAKIVIEIKDTGENRLSIKCTPSALDIAKIVVRGNGATAAHSYALRAMNALRECMVEQEMKSRKSNIEIVQKPGLILPS